MRMAVLLKGTTLDKVAIDLGKNKFAISEMYVASSGVKCLSDL